jgi:proteasome lid subunit RPN8/RPN11
VSVPAAGVTSVRLGAAAAAEIRRLAAAAYPHEGCGVLIGSYAGDSVVVQEVTSGRNLWTERLRDRYDLDPADIQAADRNARQRGLDVVGFWHSHPDHPAHPSQFDSDRAWVDSAYLIVSSRSDGTGDLNAFAKAHEAQALEPIALAPEAG